MLNGVILTMLMNLDVETLVLERESGRLLSL